jgi:uncharacterized protein YjbI with pentapeptide repeats
MLLLMLLSATLLGWHSSVRNARRWLLVQENQLRYAEEELRRARDELHDRDRVKSDRTRVLFQASLDGALLRGVIIVHPKNAFQRCSFQDCDLQDATLQGGVASFQLARFDRANLKNAKLTGGNAAFQAATFVGADLTGAVLAGGPSSFQLSSFENATLNRARLVGSFQASNVSGAHFEGADLSALDGADLVTCYFQEPPTYDGKTKFPIAFDPRALQWRLSKGDAAGNQEHE